MSTYDNATQGLSKQQFICTSCQHIGSVYELKKEFILVPNVQGPHEKICSSRLVTMCPVCNSIKVTFVPMEISAGEE
jgi:hypothetical protein